MSLYLKTSDGKYTECSFNKDGNLYIIYKVQVQRGMGHQKANEVLIVGMHRSQIDSYLEKENAIIVARENPLLESEMLILQGENSGGKVKTS